MNSRQQTSTKSNETDTGTNLHHKYRVVLFNDDYHTFEQVIVQIMRAIMCSRLQAESHTKDVHNNGSSVIFAGTIEKALRVSAMLEEIGLKTEIRCS